MEVICLYFIYLLDLYAMPSADCGHSGQLLALVNPSPVSVSLVGLGRQKAYNMYSGKLY